MLEVEVFVGEGFGAVDGRATGAVAVEEVAALDHETFDLLCVRPGLSGWLLPDVMWLC